MNYHSKSIKEYFVRCLILLSPVVILVFKFPLYETLLIGIFCHICLTLPLLNKMSINYEWAHNDETINNIPFRNKTHPFFLLTIALGIIYLFLWGVFLSLLRYFRIGTVYNIYSFWIIILDFSILAIFILLYLLIWYCIMIYFIK
jgi:hypothetical protein